MAASLAALTSLAGHRTCSGTTLAIGAGLFRLGSTGAVGTCAALGTGTAAVMMSSFSSVALAIWRYPLRASMVSCRHDFMFAHKADISFAAVPRGSASVMVWPLGYGDLYAVRSPTNVSATCPCLDRTAAAWAVMSVLAFTRVRTNRNGTPTSFKAWNVTGAAVRSSSLA